MGTVEEGMQNEDIKDSSDQHFLSAFQDEELINSQLNGVQAEGKLGYMDLSKDLESSFQQDQKLILSLENQIRKHKTINMDVIDFN
eukprot:CAMPEP_0170561276 /NCGR_PEP_ID=MMETSP0211-20121228/53796_1 /TAXON_ID=311385 /ORGANISM="Pseudokeronopsis sp., Strain OXSARD2" /LENGTH=85 /DNA_ID=CAMNT_0010876611 /DNA_START=124 /DNA_END=378 /DNA_ORIENTATION=-